MTFAVVRVCGKQYLVSEGTTITIDKPSEIKEVLLYSDDSGVRIGTPLVEGILVKSEVVSSGLGPKIRVAKFKAKSRYRRVMGFRAKQTILKITQIGEVAKKTPVKKKTASKK